MSVLYPLFPHHATHPDHLLALGRWMGVAVASPEGPLSVLELGCAAGGNLLPMATRHPTWTVTGVDLAAHEIARGQRLARAAGAEVELRCADVSTADDLGTHDVVVAHGLLSWVPPAVADALLDRVGRALKPGGVAYLSYNVAQGWEHRGRLRTWLLERVGHIDDEQARVDAARSLLPEAPAEVASLAAEVAEESDAYISQDYLAAFNHAYRYEELVEAVGRRGLVPLCDANALSLSLGTPWHPAVQQAAAAVGDDPVARARWHDTQQKRSFRSTVLARRDAVGERQGPRASWLTTELRRSAGAPVYAPGPTTFSHAWGASATIADPAVKRLLGRLGAAWPAAVPFAELEALLGAAALPIVTVLVASNLVHPRARRGDAPASTDRPEVPADVRVLAAEGSTWAADLHHRGRRLDDDDRRLLPLLDGTRSAAALASALGWPRERVARELALAHERGLRVA